MQKSEVTFAAGTNVTGVLRFGTLPINADYTRYIGVRIQSGSWTSATLSIQVSWDGTNFYPVYVTNAIPGVAPVSTQFRFFAIPAGLETIKLWSQDGSGNNTNQVNEIVVEVLH